MAAPGEGRSADGPDRWWTVGRLARRFGLSRSTLLYYHRIGLLVPSRRGHGDYRYYAPKDVQRLERIVRYRDAGVPLVGIRTILDGPESSLAEVLGRRLEDLGREMAELQEQQRMIVGILGTDRATASVSGMTRRRWSDLLSAAGFSTEDMRRWHRVFDRRAPAEHREFLRFLCIPEDEIEEIVEWAAGPAEPEHGGFPASAGGRAPTGR